VNRILLLVLGLVWLCRGSISAQDLPPLEVRLAEAWRWREIEAPLGGGSRLAVDHWPGPGLTVFFEGDGLYRFDGLSWILERKIHWGLQVASGLECIFPVGDAVCGCSDHDYVLQAMAGECQRHRHAAPVTRPCHLRDGTVLFGQQGKIFCMTPDGPAPALFPLPPGSAIHGLVCTEGGVLWCSTDAGIHRLVDGVWERVGGASAAPPGAPPLRWGVTAEDWIWFLPQGVCHGATGFVWNGHNLAPLNLPRRYAEFFDTVGFSDGSLLVAPAEGGLEVHRDGTWHAVDLPRFLWEGFLSATVVKDPEGRRVERLVLTTPAGRLFSCDLTSRRWSIHSMPRDQVSGVVLSFAPARRGGYWIGTNFGVARFDGRTYTDVHLQAGDQPFAVITAIHEDVQGHLWVGSGSSFRGAYRFDGTKWHHHGAPDGIGAGFVHTIRETPDRALWFLLLDGAGFEQCDGGLVRRDADGRVTRYTTRDGLPSNRCYDLAAGPDGDVFVGTLSGIARLDGQHWKLLQDEAEQPIQFITFSLCAVRDNTLWAGGGFSNRHIGRWRGGRWAVMHGKGWNQASACAVAEDPRGRIWFASDQGLFFFDGVACHAVSDEVGLGARSFFPMAIDSEGVVWLGSAGSGVVCHRPDDREAPVTFGVHGMVDPEIGQAAFHWQGRDWWACTRSEHLRFRWRLDGGSWSEFSTTSSFSRRDLATGPHEVTIQAVDLAGNRETDPLPFSFFVPPSFWRRPEVLGMVVALGVLALTVASMVVRRRRERRRQIKREQTMLRASEERYRTLVEEADIIVRRFGPRGEPCYTSPQMEQVTGYPVDAIHHDPGILLRLVHPEGRDTLLAFVNDRQEGVTRNREGDFRFRHRDGSWRWLFVRQRPRLGPEGELEGYDVCAVDLTQQRQLEDELHKAGQALQQAQKLESLGLLAGGIAHDFNNLLVGILGYAGLGRQGTEPGSRLEGYLGEIENAGNRAADLCRQLLAYSGRGKSTIRPVNLTELIHEMLHLIRVLLSEKTALETDLAAPLPAVEGDPAQLSQVVMNLVINAFEALAGGEGTIWIRTGIRNLDRAALDGALLGADRPEGDHVFLEVEDSAGSLDAKQLDRIFDPFFTTKPSGHGLGLAAVQGIVRGHRGVLRIVVEPERRTLFEVYFPVAASVIPPVPKTESTSDDTWRGQGGVLVVDDNPLVSDVARDTLEHVGFTVVFATDGREGFETFQSRPGEFAAVLLDMNMPRMSGDEVYRKIRELDVRVAVVLSSGYDESESAVEFTSHPRTTFIQKPYTPSALRRAVKEALG
jgi:PAS domain S-box-containing protein